MSACNTTSILNNKWYSSECNSKWIFTSHWIWCHANWYTVTLYLEKSQCSGSKQSKQSSCDGKNGYIKQTFPTLCIVKFRSVWVKSNFLKLYLSTHIADNISIYKEVQLTSQLQHSDTSLATTRPPHCLCYWPALFIHHFVIFYLHSPPPRKNTVHMCYFSFFLLPLKLQVWSCGTWNCVKLGSICTV